MIVFTADCRFRFKSQIRRDMMLRKPLTEEKFHVNEAILSPYSEDDCAIARTFAKSSSSFIFSIARKHHNY